MGKIVSSHGIKGWLKIYPFTENVATLNDYSDWLVSKDEKVWLRYKVEKTIIKNKSILVKFTDLNNRNESDSLNKNIVGIERSDLPELAPNTFYWSDLIGLDVINKKNIYYGVVDNMMETGSNDVIIVKGKKEILIPYLPDVVIKVDLEAKKILVDWDEEY
jgi:16S rRNA processing protein RimM